MAERSGSTRHHPREIRLKRDEKRLEVTFEDGCSFAYPAEFLRVESPSAEVQGHGGPKVIVAGRRHVGIMNVVPVGNYAIKLEFDDLHDSGIYDWDFLYMLGQRQDELWRTYLEALEREGKSRDP